MSKKNWKSDRILWAFAGAGVFGMLALADPFSDIGKSGTTSFSASIRGLLKGGNNPYLLAIVVFQCCLFAVPSVALGWTIQAITVVCGLRLEGQPDNRQAVDYE